jgi:hypothetical protein
MEPAPGAFDPGWLDWQVDLAERAGKQVIICLGPVKAFGYPEFFVPGHHLAVPLPEGRLVTPETHRPLLDAGVEFSARVVERYAGRGAVIAWQVEHEGVDPLGMEHSWRLSAGFVAAEAAAVRAADPSRPVLLNGFLPATAVPGRPGRRAGRAPLPEARAACGGGGEAGDDPGVAMYSCPPEDVIDSYNRCVRWSRSGAAGACAYLFWGAEYWVLRARQGDPGYLGAFARVLEAAGAAGAAGAAFSGGVPGN